MKRSHRCPKCQGQELLHIPEVADGIGDATANPPPGERQYPLMTGFYAPLRIARVLNPDRGKFDHRDAAAGLVEAWICRSCDYTELYTRDAARLPPDGVRIRLITPPASDGPFR